MGVHGDAWRRARRIKTHIVVFSLDNLDSRSRQLADRCCRVGAKTIRSALRSAALCIARRSSTGLVGGSPVSGDFVVSLFVFPRARGVALCTKVVSAAAVGQIGLWGAPVLVPPLGHFRARCPWWCSPRSGLGLGRMSLRPSARPPARSAMAKLFVLRALRRT